MEAPLGNGGWDAYMPYRRRSGRSSLSQGKPGTGRRTTGSMPDEATKGRQASISALDGLRTGQRDHIYGW
jgi:hypothetical protein